MAVAVVVSHAHVADELGHIGEWLHDAGFSVERVFREHLPGEVEGELLVSLGSPESVAEGHMKPGAEAEVELVGRWVSADRPFLGVCFGAQVLARATGGSVHRMPRTYRAYTPLELSPSAPEQLRGGWSVWHEDAISAPSRADVKATLPHADAAFRVGRAWGIQPHIEFDSDIVRRLVDKMSVKPGGWEALYEGLRADDDGHARRSNELLTTISSSW